MTQVIARLENDLEEARHEAIKERKTKEEERKAKEEEKIAKEKYRQKLIEHGISPDE